MTLMILAFVVMCLLVWGVIEFTSQHVKNITERKSLLIAVLKFCIIVVIAAAILALIVALF